MPGAELHGIRLELADKLAFDAGNGEREFWLAPDSPGVNAGVVIPNFNDDYVGGATGMTDGTVPEGIMLGQNYPNPFEGGNHVSHWDGRDRTGHRLASGMYLCVLRTSTTTQVRHLVLLR